MIYEALSNIRHNDVTYEAGQIVQDLDENAAKLLLEAGVVVAKEEQKAEQAAAGPRVYDGFPDHSLDPKPMTQPQPQEQSQPALAPSQPSGPSPEQVDA